MNSTFYKVFKNLLDILDKQIAVAYIYIYIYIIYNIYVEYTYSMYNNDLPTFSSRYLDK